MSLKAKAERNLPFIDKLGLRGIIHSRRGFPLDWDLPSEGIVCEQGAIKTWFYRLLVSSAW
jgi:hypothetical protein